MTSVGTTAPRGDGYAKVRGSADYTVDLTLPGMLTAQIFRSPVARGRIVRLDVERSRTLPGVWAVLTASDAPTTRSGLAIRDQLLFASDLITHEGEAIAAVAAETPEAARAALAAIEIEIEELSPVVDLDAALADDSPLVHPEWESFEPVGSDFPRRGNLCAEMVSDPGGVDEIFASAARIVEGEYRAGRQYQAYLEPRGVVATFESGRYTLHISHQFPFNVRDRMAAALGIRPSAIRVIGHHIGGGFGAKLDLGIEPYAALLARATRRPVRLVNDRTEDLMTCQCRENAIIRMRSAVDSEGRVLARDMDVLMDAGAAATDIPYLVSIPLILAGSTYQLVYGRTNQTGLPVIEQVKEDGYTAYIENDPVTGEPLMLRSSSGIQTLYVYDGLGSPVALLTNYATTAYAYTFDPYGVAVLTAGGGGNGVVQNPFLFKGGIQDRATGWVHYGNRWYNPTIGRWTQQDTLDAPLDPANANRYAYAGCDPINNSDPTGLDTLSCGFAIFLLVAGGIGLVSSLYTLIVGSPTVVGGIIGALGATVAIGLAVVGVIQVGRECG
jgi:RHS repeat-associated protein